MKKLLIIVFFVSNTVYAQNWQEWTQQKKTQIKYLLQQIAATKVYIAYLQKGYSIANRGITTIRKIKSGDFDLHYDFLSSLKAVNPTIKNSGKVVGIIALQIKIIRESTQAVERIRELNQFTTEETNYCSKVFDNLLEDCLKNIDELFMVISSGEVTMTDDERMKRIDKLYADMQSKYGFCVSFSNEMGILTVQRFGELKTLRIWQK